MHRFHVLPRLLSCLLILVIGATVAVAQQPGVNGSGTAPALIKLQGTIANVPGGTTEITFALYSGRTGGTPLWIETQNVTLDERGSYIVYVGASQEGGIPADLFTNGGACYLGVQPEGQPEQDRIALSPALAPGRAAGKEPLPPGQSIWPVLPASEANSADSKSGARAPNSNLEQNLPAATSAPSQAASDNTLDSGSGTGAPRTVTLPAAASVDTATVTLNGVVSPNGSTTTYWFEYATNEGMGKASQTAHQSLLAGPAEYAISAKVTGLMPHAVYYFRLVAQNTSGTSRGRTLAFQSNGAGERGTTVTLTIATTGTGSGTVTATPTGRSCGTGCYTYPSGTVVTLTATANTGSSSQIGRAHAPAAAPPAPI